MSKVNTYEAEVRDNIQRIVNMGFELIKVDYERGFGEDEGHDYIDCKASNVSEAVEAVLAVDDAHLFIKTPKGDEVWVYFVLGNEAGVVVNDWSIPADKEEARVLETCINEASEKWEEE